MPVEDDLLRSIRGWNEGLWEDAHVVKGSYVQPVSCVKMRCAAQILEKLAVEERRRRWLVYVARELPAYSECRCATAWLVRQRL